MIEIDFKSQIYVCPFCGCRQSYGNSFSFAETGFRYEYRSIKNEKDVGVFHIKCTNKSCNRVTVIARDIVTGKQFDLYPNNVFKTFPDYVPLPIRNDYKEAMCIIDESPKAAATLLRRCMQGMIRDFWGIQKQTLYDEVIALEEKVPSSQWKAIDALRKLGNIGAHMEKDINLIIDVDKNEALALSQLIELLIEKWYIARHDEENVYASITKSAESKKQ